MAAIPTLSRLRPEDCEFETNPGCSRKALAHNRERVVWGGEKRQRFEGKFIG